MKFFAETGFVNVYYFDEETGIYLGKGKEHVVAGTTLPPDCTEIKPPRRQAGHAIIKCADGWTQVEDHRGKYFYRKHDGKRVMIRGLGQVPDTLTLKHPRFKYSVWNGEDWERDTPLYIADLHTVIEQELNRSTMVLRGITIRNRKRSSPKVSLTIEEWELYQYALVKLQDSLNKNPRYPVKLPKAPRVS